MHIDQNYIVNKNTFKISLELPYNSCATIYFPMLQLNCNVGGMDI